MPCESASKPVSAVTLGGIEVVRAGSQSATVGRTYGPPAQSLMPDSGSKTPQPEVASAPVPAVVGTAMMSGPFLEATFAGAQLAPVRRWVYSWNVPPLPISSETALALSIELPPPTATIRSHVALLVHRDGRLDRGEGRLGDDAVEDLDADAGLA